MFHVVSHQQPALRMKNDSSLNGLTISPYNCQRCNIRPSCSSICSVNQGDLVLIPDMDFSDDPLTPFMASLQLNSSLYQIFNDVLNASAKFPVYFPAMARRFVLQNFGNELVDWLNYLMPSKKHLKWRIQSLDPPPIITILFCLRQPPNCPLICLLLLLFVSLGFLLPCFS